MLCTRPKITFCPGATLPCQDATSAVPAGTAVACADGVDLDRYRSLLECLAEVPEPRRRPAGGAAQARPGLSRVR